MKKNEYVTPEMEVVEIKTESFIADSFVGGGTTPGDGGIGGEDDL